MKPNKITIEVTEEQFNRDLLNKLEESGHKITAISGFNYAPYLVAFGEGDNAVITNLLKPQGYIIPGYNPELFLAIVNMSSLKQCRKGEYVKYVGEREESFTPNKLYRLNNDLDCEKAIDQDDRGRQNGFNRGVSSNYNYKKFVKPTFEEILAHFGVYSPNFKITSEMMAEKLKKIQELVK